MGRMNVKYKEIDQTFCTKVEHYLKKNDRTQRWLLTRIREAGIAMAPSTLNLRIGGIYPFTPTETEAIKLIMKKYKQ